MWAVAEVVPGPAGAKVFCFFFSKKKRFPFFEEKGVDGGFRRHDVGRPVRCFAGMTLVERWAGLYA
jgi:hypothetical protein